MTITKPDTYKIKFAGGKEEEFVYSPEFRKYMDEVKTQLRRNSWILVGVLLALLIAVIIGLLLVTQTGIVGRLVAQAVECQT